MTNPIHIVMNMLPEDGSSVLITANFTKEVLQSLIKQKDLGFIPTIGVVNKFINLLDESKLVELGVIEAINGKVSTIKKGNAWQQ